MLTIKDISRLSGCSITTVSRALNNYTDISKETKEKILKICNEHGYTPSALGRNLSTKRTYTIGIVFQEETSLGLTHPFFAELLNEFKIEVEKLGYDILLIGKRIGKYVQSYASHIKQKSVDGVIILSSFPDTEEIKELLESNTPKVFMQSVIEGQSCFFSDNRKAISEIVEHLYEQGHRRIGFIAGDVQTTDGKNRLIGYQKCLAKLGLEYDDSIVKYGENYTFEEGRNCANDFYSMGEDMPSAIVCSSDTLAIGCLRTLVDLGVDVPKRVSITGFDNIALSNFVNPRLTTVNQNKNQLAKKATEWLVDCIENKNSKTVHEMIDCDVIFRKSVSIK